MKTVKGLTGSSEGKKPTACIGTDLLGYSVLLGRDFLIRVSSAVM